jgi:Ferritin-like domain
VLERHLASFEEIQEKIVNSLNNNPATSSSQPPLGNGCGTTRSETNGVKRRSFLKGFGATSALLLPMTAMLANRAKGATSNASVPISKGDAAILTFLGAAEIIESDLWLQYWELGGTQDNEFAKKTGGNAFYTDALSILDSDMAQYVHDNTDDEITHAAFIRNYLASRGASTADLDLLNGHTFRTLPGSTAQGSSGKLRLTNLTALNVDTSFWTRYRSDSQNPDLNPGFKFGQAQNRPKGIKNRTAIPRDDADTAGSSIGNPTDHLKAIAFTAGFHFATIEQGGTSLYPSLAQRVQDKEVLQVVLSIGPTEAMHFQTWQDKAGNATPLTDTDPVTGSVVTFVDLTTNQPQSLQSNLIMPEPCPFINTSLPICSIVRPTNTQGAAMAAAKFLIAMNLFAGQSGQFFQLLLQLAADADAASG